MKLRSSLWFGFLLLFAAALFVWRKPAAERSAAAPKAGETKVESTVPTAVDSTPAAPASSPTPPASALPTTATQFPAEVSAFRAWAQTYLAAPGEERTALEAQGRELARAHTAKIASLIREDPRQALESAVPMVVRQDLPRGIVDLLEKRESLRGAYEVYGNVPQPGAATATAEFQPYTRSVTTDDGTRYNAFVYGERAGQRSSVRASLYGIAVGQDLALAEGPARPLEVGERPRVGGRAIVEACPVSGRITDLGRTATGDLPAITEETPALETEERIIYVCSGGHIEAVVQQLTAEEERAHWLAQGIDLNSGAGSGSGPAPIGTIPGSFTTGHRRFLYIRATFPDHLIDPQSEAECHDSLRQMADYITQTSYGRCYFTYAVPPLVVLPYPESWYAQYQADGSSADTLIQNQARTLARAMGFDYLSYDLDAVRWNGAVGSYGGSASVGARGMRLKTNSVGTFIHELGHNLGVWHANAWQTSPPSSIGPGNNLEYGNIFDVMGSSGTSGQYTAHFKNILSWLPTETHWTVTQSGLYRIHQFDYAVADPSFRYALRVAKDAEREYWAEFRQRFASNVGLTNGLMITWDGWGQGNIGGSGGSPPDGSNKGAQLLDMTPGSFGDGITDTRNDSALWIGRTFSDPDANIHITPVGKNAGTPPSMDVYVSVGTTPGNRPPTLGVTASSLTAGTGVAITLTAAATDPDGDTLAYAWVFGDGTYSTNNNPVQTKSWSTAGYYQVLCTASDMKGQRTMRSVLITVGSPTNFTVSGNITGPDGQPLEGVYVANYAPSNLTSHPNSATFKGTWTDSSGNYTLTGLGAGSYTISPTLYPFVFTASGFTNPVAVGPSATNRNFTSTRLPTITLNVTNPVAQEGATPVSGTVRIERTGSTAAALNVQIFNASTGTALRNVDYTLSPAPTPSTSGGGSGAAYFTIPAGAAFLDVTVTPINDGLAEGTEYAVLNFANTSAGYVLAGPATAVVTILDDESPNLPVVKLLCPDPVASEAGPDPATFRLERTGATIADLTVKLTYAGTATFGVDYLAPATVVIPAGSAAVTFTLTPIDDTLQEGTETAIVSLTADAAYARDTQSNSQTAIIHDNDLPTVTVAATVPTASEATGTAGIFTITRTGGDPTQALTVDYALAGRAVHGVDYRRLDGRAVIPAGVMSTRVEIQPLDDGVAEGTQDVILLLRSATTYAIGGTGTATVNITDNDGSQMYVKLITSAGTEPVTGSATVISFQIIRPAGGTAITVNYAVSGTATPGVDYTALPGSIAFASGDTSKTINVVALADAEFEDAETVTLTLLPGTGYTLMASQNSSATGYILDGNQPTVDVAVADTGSGLTVQGSETSTGNALRFLISRKTATASPLVVNYTMSGTATEGVDYTGTTGSVTIPASATGAYVVITPVNDTIPEGVETIVMTLTPAPGIYGRRTASATMLLGDNDAFASGTLAFAAATSSVTEGAGTHNVTVTLTGTPTATASVAYRVSGGTATGRGYDFTLPDGVLTFPPGTTSQVIAIQIHPDSLPEPSETIVLQLFNAVGANLGASSHTVTINNLSLPEAFTDAPTAVLGNSATLNGRVLPNGVATDVWFAYGPTAAYGSTTPVQSIGSGTSLVNVNAAISGLVPSGYHFRCVATNSLGTTFGIDQVVPTNTVTLASLAASVGTLSPSFTPATRSYTLVVGSAVSSVTLTPTATDAAASLKVNGVAVPSGSSSQTLALSPGSNTLTVFVTAPDQNSTTTYTITAQRQTPYQTWASARNLTGPNSGPDEDFDGDGQSNFLEYTINTDPAVATTGAMTSVQTVVNAGDNKRYLTVSHRRRIVPGAIAYGLQVSSNLATWSALPLVQLQQTDVVPLGDGVIEIVTYRVLPALEDAPGPRYIRLTASE